MRACVRGAMPAELALAVTLSATQQLSRKKVAYPWRVALQQAYALRRSCQR